MFSYSLGIIWEHQPVG